MPIYASRNLSTDDEAVGMLCEGGCSLAASLGLLTASIGYPKSRLLTSLLH